VARVGTVYGARWVVVDIASAIEEINNLGFEPHLPTRTPVLPSDEDAPSSLVVSLTTDLAA
jgi:hypothetical protein